MEKFIQGTNIFIRRVSLSFQVKLTELLFAGDYPQNEDTLDFLNVTLSEHAVLAKDKLNDHVQFPGE